MSDPQADLKARLLAKAEAAIDEMLARRKAPNDTKLADLEQNVLKAGQQIEQALTTELVLKDTARWARVLWGWWRTGRSARRAAGA